MLQADDRTYLSDILTPPPSHQLDRAIITTYSLDLTTLLVIPLFLALRASDDLRDTLDDDISVYETLSRMADRLDVLCEPGRISATGRHFRLYGMLEDSVHAARARHASRKGEGAFHPKVWLLRFVDDSDGTPLYRLCVMSRNIQRTLHWDAALIIDGRPAPDGQPAGDDDLVRFVRALPELVDGDGGAFATRCDHMADELAGLTWELPQGFDDLRFHAFGLGEEQIPLPTGAKLGVVSPFVSPRTLERFADRYQAQYLVSRATELSSLSYHALQTFNEVHVLDEFAEPDDSDDEAQGSPDDHRVEGLHAKLFITEQEGRTRLLLGSGNATNPVWCPPHSNIEFFAALDGDTEAVGGLDRFFGADGFGRFLVPFDMSHQEDDEDSTAERLLEDARHRLARADFKLRCHQRDGDWFITVAPHGPLALPGIERIRAWPATRSPDASGRRATSLMDGEPLTLRAGDLAFVTRFVGFQLHPIDGDESLRFIVHIADAELPPNRDAALMAQLLETNLGFLRYIRMLLAADDSFQVFEEMRRQLRHAKSRPATDRGDDIGLLEPMVAAFCRGDHRLAIVKRRVDKLRKLDRDIIPPEFDDLWATFESLIDSEYAQEAQ